MSTEVEQACGSPVGGMGTCKEEQSLEEGVQEPIVRVSKPCLEENVKINVGTAELLSQLDAQPRSELLSPIATAMPF